MKVHLLIFISLFFLGCDGSKNDSSLIPIESSSTEFIEITDDYDTTNTFQDSTTYDFLKQTQILSKNDILDENIARESIKGIWFESNLQNQTKSNQIKITNLNLYVAKGADSLFIQEQNERSKGKKWDLKKIGAYDAIKRYEYWERRNTEFDWDEFKSEGFGCFVSIGIPLFNSDYTVAIVYVGTTCHGTLGNGTIYKFERSGTATQWEFSESMQLWIS